METRGSKFSAEMQIRVIDVLLDKIYYLEEHCLQRSRFLVRKAGALRACGVQNIESCLKSLSEAISLLVSSNLILPFLFSFSQKGISRLIFLHQTSKPSQRIHLKATQL